MHPELIALVDGHGVTGGWEFTPIKVDTLQGLDHIKSAFMEGQFKADWLRSRALLTTNLNRLGAHVDYIYFHPIISAYPSKFTLEAFKVGADGLPLLLYVAVNVPSEPVVVRAFHPGQIVLSVALQPVKACDRHISIELRNPLTGTTTMVVSQCSRQRVTLATIKPLVSRLVES